VDNLKLSVAEPIILYLGRLHKKKGLELLLTAAGEIENMTPQVLIAGDGDPGYRALLMNLVSDLELDDRVHFLGHVSGQQKQALLQGADLLALTSYAENFAIVVAESLAAGTPVLVTNTVGIAEQIASQGVGAVCEPDKAAVLEALKALLADQRKLAQMGEEARELAAKQFDWAQIAMRLKAAYEGCLDSPR
jgi:glycosyltransferase involved in cell wall biosynthesis